MVGAAPRPHRGGGLPPLRATPAEPRSETVLSTAQHHAPPTRTPCRRARRGRPRSRTATASAARPVTRPPPGRGRAAACGCRRRRPRPRVVEPCQGQPSHCVEREWPVLGVLDTHVHVRSLPQRLVVVSGRTLTRGSLPAACRRNGSRPAAPCPSRRGGAGPRCPSMGR